MSKSTKTATGCRPDQLFGVWAIEPNRFNQMRELATSVDLVALGQARSARAAEDADAEDIAYTVIGGIARFDLTGPMTKYSTSFQQMIGGTSTLKLRLAIRMAMNDETVLGALMVVDSPGGTVDGTLALAEDIAAFVARKPMVMFCEGMACSAAYWCASQGTSIFASKTSLIGSIGTRMRLEDSSGKYAQDGVVVHEITTGSMKAAGAAGTPITDEQKAYFQSIADDMQSHFAEGVQKGRGMTSDQFAAVSDAKVYTAQKAATAGLVDQVGTEEDALDALYQRVFFGPRQ